MKILLWHHFYAQEGGEDRVLQAEMEGLRARGHEVRLLSRRSNGLPLGGALAALAASSNRVSAHLLEAELEAFKPDLVHAHNLFPGWGIAPLKVLIRRRQAAVQTLHNFRWLCAKATLLRDGQDCRLCAGGDFLPAVKYACFRGSHLLSASYGLALHSNRRQGLAERAFGRLICVSDFVRASFEAAAFGQGRLCVKGHFVDEAPGPTGDDGGLVFAGRLAEEKGFEVLGRALLDLPEARLTVVGEGPQRQAWESRLGSRARFVGRLDREALTQLMRRSRAVVVPSLGTETFGLTALEAMACGKAVLASDAGGLPELIRDGENGLLHRRGDAQALAGQLAGLLDDPDKAKRMGALGLERVKKDYLAGSNLKMLETIYSQALEENSKL